MIITNLLNKIINYLIKLSFCTLFRKRKDILDAFIPSTKIKYNYNY